MLHLVNSKYANRARRLAELRPNRLGLADAYPFLSKALRLLLICLGGLAGMSATACAQPPQAQLIKKALTVNCGERQYDVGFVSVRTTLPNSQPARALGIILSSPTAGNLDKVFCLYAVGEKDIPATHRDAVTGLVELRDSDPLQTYGDGLIGDKKTHVVTSFFSKAGCKSDSLQIDGIRSTISSIRLSDSLNDYLKVLNEKIAGSPLSSLERELLESSSTESASWGNSEASFAQAVHQFVMNTWKTPVKLASPIPTQVTLENPSKSILDQFVSLIPMILVACGLLVILLLAWSTLSKRPSLKLPWFRAGNGEKELSPDIRLLTAPARLAELMGKYNKKSSSTYFPEKVKSDAQVQRLQGHLDDLLEKLKLFHAELQSEIKAGLPPQSIWQRFRAQKEERIFLSGQLINAPSQLAERINVFSKKNGDVKFSDKVKSIPEVQKLIHHCDGLLEDLSSFHSALAAEIKACQGQPTESSDSTDQSISSTETEDAYCQPPLGGAINNNLAAEISQIREHLATLAEQQKGADEGRQVLFGLWSSWYAQQYNGGPTIKWLTEVQAVFDLYRELGHHFSNRPLNPVETRQHFNTTVSYWRKIGESYLEGGNRAVNLQEIARQAEKKLEDDKQKLQEYSGAQQRMATILGKYYNERSRNLESAIEGVLAQANKVRGLEDQCADLQERLRQANAQLEASKKLVVEVGNGLHYTGLGESGESVLHLSSYLRRERQDSKYWQLRLALSSTLLALENGMQPSSRDEVVALLNIDKLKAGLADLLLSLQNQVGHDLWDRGFQPGFTNGWLHQLLRADLLLQTYFADQPEYRMLRRAVAMGSGAVQAALLDLGVEVAEIELFEPLPEGIDSDPAHPNLRNLPVVRNKVRQKLHGSNQPSFVVDVFSFPFRVKGITEGRGRVAVVNPSAWLQ